jgi:hypothetical protein
LKTTITFLIEFTPFHISKEDKNCNERQKEEIYSDDEENQGDLSEGSIKEYEKTKSYLYDDGKRSPETSAENYSKKAKKKHG